VAELAAENKTGESDEQQAEDDNSQCYEPPEEGTWGDFSIAYCDYRFLKDIVSKRGRRNAVKTAYLLTKTNEIGLRDFLSTPQIPSGNLNTGIRRDEMFFLKKLKFSTRRAKQEGRREKKTYQEYLWIGIPLFTIASYSISHSSTPYIIYRSS